MKKSDWKEKLIVQGCWVSNGHWAANTSVASRIRGLKGLLNLNLKPGVYVHHEWAHEFKADVEKVVNEGCLAEAESLRDTGVTISKSGGDTLRLLVGDSHKVYAIQERYSEFLDLGLPMHIQNEGIKVGFGDPSKPDAVVMVRYLGQDIKAHAGLSLTGSELSISVKFS